MTTSIARRLLVGLTATVFVSSALVVALAVIYQLRAGRNDLESDITASVAAFSQMIEPALWDLDSTRVRRVADAFAQDPRVARLTVREASTGQTQVVSPINTADTASRSLPVKRGDQLLGDVTVSFDRGYYRQLILYQLAGAIGATLIALIATLVAFQVLFRRLLRRPLDDLAAMVRGYAAGDYRHAETPIPYTEFAELGRLLDTMSDQIRSQISALAAANRELSTLNRFLQVASSDLNPRELTAEATRELQDLFGASNARAEIAGEQGGTRQTVYVHPPGITLESTSQVVMQVPIVIDGVATGSLALRRESSRPFTDAEMKLANAVAAQVAASITRYRGRGAERLLRAAIEQLPEAVIITDRDKHVLYANPAFTAHTGYTVAEALGKVPRDLKRASDHDPMDDEVIETVGNGETFIGRLRSRKKTGEVYFEDVVITPVRDDSGEIANHVSIGRDVTVEMQRDEQLRHAQRMDAIGQLAGGVAHDFNNMLAIVLMQLDLLGLELKLTPEQQQSVQNMRDALDRAANLTRQLLMFSRRQAMRLEEHDLTTIVHQMLRILRRVIGEKIDVTFDPPVEPVGFEGDAGMIEQVIVNLCVNARDAMPNGGRLTVTTSRESLGQSSGHPGTWACLTVRDTGTGMTDDVRARIFEPFFTTKEVGQGTGLGLATTHGIVTQHGGWITVDSAVGEGSTFKVYLPALSHVPVSLGAHAPRTMHSGGATILVVEDESAVREMISMSLEKLGHRAIVATNAREALRTWAEHAEAIDLVLTDMVMPDGMTGIDLIEELRRVQPDVPAVLMSGYSLQLADALPRDVTYLAKPFSVAALSRVIGETLASFRA